MVLDTALGAAAFHRLAGRMDEEVLDPERAVQPVLRHRLTQLHQHEGPVGLALPLKVSPDEETLRRLWGQLSWRTQRRLGGSQSLKGFTCRGNLHERTENTAAGAGADGRAAASTHLEEAWRSSSAFSRFGASADQV